MVRYASMDREEAIRLLGGGPEGVVEWNRRRGSGEAIPNLSGADFRKANLGGVDLSGAIIRGAILSEADLSGAILYKADLTFSKLGVANLRGAELSLAKLLNTHVGGANLGGANLSGALLLSTDFSEAELGGAILIRAELRGTNFYRANLSGADLTEAICIVSRFDNVDLSDVKGLDTITHYGPSTVGIDTLFRSGGKIPDTFLRGCGVPDVLIANQKSLVGALEPIQFYSCFISYSTKNQDFAERLHSRLRDKGLRIWFAPEDAQGGKKLDEQIDEAIRIYDKLLLVLSPESMASEWVRTEIRTARRAERLEKRRKLFPISLVPFEAIRDWKCFDADSGKDLGVEIREYYIPDFSNWKDHDSFEKEFKRLLKDLRTEESTIGKEP
jgi:hypothetical protein